MQNRLDQFSIDFGPGSRLDGAIRQAVDAIHTDSLVRSVMPAGRPMGVPSLERLASIVSGLQAVMFADVHASGRNGSAGIRQLRLSMNQLGLEIRHALQAGGELETPNLLEQRISSILEGFAQKLPEVRRMLALDAEAIHDGDPASNSLLEVYLSSPGLRALLHHRIAHALYELDVPLIPRMIGFMAQQETGIDIHPAARIGEACFIDHGSGIVIGEGAEVGREARIYQGVTLGSRSIPRDASGRALRGQRRHPRIGNRVAIFSGASILGPITVGDDSIIGGNVWLTRDVEPGSRVVQHDPQHSRFSSGAGI